VGRVLQPIPYGATARRLEWSLLPPHLRSLVERRLGAPVVAATSRDGGFTPGMASVLTCADGSRHFAKAASTKAQRSVAEAYAEEARRLARVPDGAPVPSLTWWHRDDDWVVVVAEHVAGRAPRRPTDADDLDRCLDALEACASALTPAPDGLVAGDLADELADGVTAWDRLRRAPPADLPGLADHVEEAAALASAHAGLTTGDTVVHTEVRDDHLLLADDGRTLVSGWTFPARGAAWVDTVVALVGAHGDGIDADAILEGRSLTHDVGTEAVDALLALLAGWYLEARERPVPPVSPWLRAHQDQLATSAWGWLAARRGWL
jgi:hypothetical protein